MDNYSALSVDKDDLVGNVMQARRFEYNRQIAKLGRPIDHGEWGMAPQMVSAYLAADERNSIPAAILQPPFSIPQPTMPSATAASVQ
jgi:predicted metalloendopeptidase